MVVLYHSSQMYTRASGSSVGGLRLNRPRDHRQLQYVLTALGTDSLYNPIVSQFLASSE